MPGRCRPTAAAAPRPTSAHLQRPVQLGDGKDLLVRLPVGGGEHGAQHLVPADHIPQRRAQRHRHPRRRTAAPPPGCCTARLGPSSCPMNHSRCCANDNGTRSGRGCGTSAARAGRAPRQPGRQPGRGRRLEHRPHRHLGPQHRPDPADQPDRQQRVPAQGEEVILGPDRLQPEHVRRTPGTTAPPGTSAGPRPAAGARPEVRGRQRRPVQLPVRRQRQRRPAPPPRRAPCTPAAATPRTPAPPAQRRRPRRPAPRRPGPRRPTSRLSPGACPRRAITAACATCGQAGQHRLDLARLDPEPADLHLLIGPAREHQLPVRGSTGPDPRSGTSAPRPAPNGHATNRSAVSPARPSIPPRQPRPRHIQLPRHPRRHRAQPLIQHEHPRIADRPPDRGTARAAVPAPPGSRRAHRGLGRPVRRSPAAAPAAAHRAASPAAQRLTRRPPARRAPAPGRPAPAPASTAGGTTCTCVTPAAAPPAPPAPASAALRRRRHHQHAPDASATAQLQHRRVETAATRTAAPGRPRPARARRAAPPPVVRQPAVGHHHALRRPGRPRGVDHVRRLPRPAPAAGPGRRRRRPPPPRRRRVIQHHQHRTGQARRRAAPRPPPAGQHAPPARASASMNAIRSAG